MIHKITKSVFLFVCVWTSACEKEYSLYIPDDYNKLKYYSHEILPDEHKGIYGRWKLESVSGGFSGTGHDPDFDYLEIRRIGIYGLFRNDTLFEYGKIKLDTFDTQNTDMLQVKFIPEFFSGHHEYFPFPGMYIDFESPNKLNVNSPCCDFYNYHFVRVLKLL